MDIKEAIVSRRTVRSFCDEYISSEVLKEICKTSRLYASAANLQPIRFSIINDSLTCKEVFQHVHLAGYIPDYKVLPQNEPPAYILLSTELKVSKNPQFDAGAAATNIMLLAKEYGLDTCCIGNFSKEDIATILEIDLETYRPMYLIAVGKSTQKNEIKSMSDTVKYTFEEGRFIVPKRDLKDVFI